MKIRHIGIIYTICSNKKIVNKNNLREDLDYDRYAQLGVTERFSNEKPYRICKKCLKIIKDRQNEKSNI